MYSTAPTDWAIHRVVAERKNFKLLFSAGIVWPLRFQIYIFRPMRMTDAILSGSPARVT